MALLDVLALLDATSIYRGAIIRIGNAPATSEGRIIGSELLRAN
jgi:hypothetical protein